MNTKIMTEVKRGRGRPRKVQTHTKVNKVSKYKQLTTQTLKNVKKEKYIESNIISLGNGVYKCTICPYSSSKKVGLKNYLENHSRLIQYKKYHQSQTSNQISLTSSELSVEAVCAEATANISLSKSTGLDKRIIEVENNLNKIKQSLDKILQDNSLLAEKEAKTKKAFESLQKENSALHERLMKQVSQSNVLMKNSMNQDDPTERIQQENVVLQEQLQRTFQKNVQIKKEEQEINEKYIEQKRQNSELDEKLKAIELEYSEEKMIGALYHDIFSKQQKKIDLLQNLLQESNSNLQLDDKTSNSSKKTSLEIHTIFDYSSENGHLTGPDFVVTNLKHSNTETSCKLSEFQQKSNLSSENESNQNAIPFNKGESESKIRVKQGQIGTENKISELVKDSIQYKSFELTSKGDSIEFHRAKSKHGKFVIHKCILCPDFQHRRLISMMRHLANVHGDHSVLLCSECNYATKSKVSLDKHVRDCHTKHTENANHSDNIAISIDSQQSLCNNSASEAAHKNFDEFKINAQKLKYSLRKKLM